MAVGLVAAALAIGCTSPDESIEPIDASSAEDDIEVDGTEVEPEVDAGSEEAAEDEGAGPDLDGDEAPPVDVTVIPDEITLEYVDAVLVELERLFAEAVRSVVEEGEMTLSASDRLSSAFGGSELDSVFADLLVIADDPMIVKPPAEIAPNDALAVAVLDSGDACLWVEAVVDLSGVFATTPEPRATFLLLRGQDRELVVDMNPTPWVYRAIRVGADEELRVETPCQ